MRSSTNCSSWAIEKRTLRPMRTGTSCSVQMSWYTDDRLIARIVAALATSTRSGRAGSCRVWLLLMVVGVVMPG